MSGGSWDYLYGKVSAAADRILAEELNEECWHPPVERSYLREQFANHLELVAQALHDIEWVDSGDCSPGSEIEAINKVLKKE